MSEFHEELFDEQKIKKAMKKGKRRTIWLVAAVSLAVFAILQAVNFAATLYFSQKAFERWDAYVRLSTPNGYISETVDTRGFLGGVSHYKVSKDMKIKPVVMEQKQYAFGLNMAVLVSRSAGGNVGIDGSRWQYAYKENGWREMMFFHPDIAYKKYPGVSGLMNQMEDGNIYELALSFDRLYTKGDLPFASFPELTWFWVDSYSTNQLKEMKKEAAEYDWSAAFIREHETTGFTVREPMQDWAYSYSEFKELLQKSFTSEHKQAYEMLKDQAADEVKIAGAVVYGTKEQLAEYINHPAVKAISLGGVIADY